MLSENFTQVKGKVLPENFTYVKEKYWENILMLSTTEIEFNRHLYFGGSKPEVTALSLLIVDYALRIISNFFTLPKHNKSNELSKKVNINPKSYFVTSKK